MPHRIRIFLALVLLSLPLFCPALAVAQITAAPPAATREKTPLDAWRFAAQPQTYGIEKPGFDDHAWASVTLPHTWNTKSDMKTQKAAWYRTHFTLTDADRGREIFVYFDGAATIADVYLNGVHLGQHRGAYTRFIFDGTAHAVFDGDNVLTVRCDTDPKETADCLPSGTGFQLYHVYGGLYRRVWLLKTAPVHVDPTDDASSGVYLTPQNITADDATLVIKTLVRNDSSEPKTVTVTDTVRDGANQVVATAAETLTLKPKSSGFSLQHPHVTQPHLWSTTDPYLYHVTATTETDGQVTDAVTERTGFRYFQMTTTGFFLNGVQTQLRGVAKHQETEEHASAVTEADLRQDWDGLHELGVNFVRLAHYPHAALEYDMADERGIVIWAENGHSQPAAPTATGDIITREMIRQNYNHPSICFWSIGNEAIQNLSDITTLEHYAHTARAQDPTRLITYASNSGYHLDPALDFIAANRYMGWYGGAISAFDAHAVYYHWISETGAGGVISIHSPAYAPTHRVNTYEPEEYQQEVAESRCQTVFRDRADLVPLFTWWTFRDFADPRYKGVNSKGLETYGGFRKDIFYLFQSFLKPDTPVVHLCGKPWFLRRSQSPFDQLSVKAYSNASALTLTVNGATVGPAQNGDYFLPDGTRADNVFSWDSPLKPGRNVVRVDDGAGNSDSAVIYAEKGEETGRVQNLSSSNPLNPAYFL
ncbi:MAG: beta galactosidase jelly roll domain-containing protein, partial [Armatimonadota bacterium]|nr:beta galactosidase jelly roll domain-containing protein [Armatimonadota bacterium]